MRTLPSLLSIVCLMLFVTAPSAQAGKKVAFLVGINKYAKPGFRNLEYAERDVTETGKELKQLGFDVTTLVGQQVTKANFVTTIDKLVAPLTKDDLILVMLAGHGQQRTGGDAYYCPYDAIITKDESLVSLSKLLNETLAPNVGTKLLLIDACRNDPDPGRGRSVGIQGKVIALPEDTAVMFSCRSGQQSFENDKIQHGVFTYCLLDALRGGGRDDEISWFGMVSHVSRKMSSDEMKVYLPSGRQQTPIPAGGVPFTVLARVETKPITPKMTPPVTTNNQKTITNSVGMKLNLIPAGEFMMGSGKSPEELARLFDSKAEYFTNEHPQHKVNITQPFYLATTEVTQKQWQTVMGTTPWKGKDYEKEGDDYPATYINWNDAQEFIKKLNQKEGTNSYRLPTEAEWEYACRAGSKSMYTFGDSTFTLKEYAWFGENTLSIDILSAHRVGQKRANSFGLFDMQGNVCEWCSDWYGGDYYRNSPVADPHGPSGGSSRVLRGGSWDIPPFAVRSASRGKNEPDNRFYFTGFRVLFQ